VPPLSPPYPQGSGGSSLVAGCAPCGQLLRKLEADAFLCRTHELPFDSLYCLVKGCDNRLSLGLIVRVGSKVPDKLNTLQNEAKRRNADAFSAALCSLVSLGAAGFAGVAVTPWAGFWLAPTVVAMIFDPLFVLESLEALLRVLYSQEFRCQAIFFTVRTFSKQFTYVPITIAPVVVVLILKSFLRYSVSWSMFSRKTVTYSVVV